MLILMIHIQFLGLFSPSGGLQAWESGVNDGEYESCVPLGETTMVYMHVCVLLISCSGNFI